MVSVAICTCNGGQFIREQLESIFNQTLQPGEIILCDDLSDDNTVEIAREVSADFNFPIEIFQNNSRLGVARNFCQAISLCRGDLIALSDQDDIWLPGKLEKMSGWLSQPANTNIQVLFTDLEIVDSRLTSLGRTMWEHLGFNEKLRKRWRKGKALEVMILNGNFTTGASVIFRSSFFKRNASFIEKPHSRWIHDGLIALSAARESGIDFIEEPLVLYRQHEKQLIGAKEEDYDRSYKSSLTRFRNIISGKSKLAEINNMLAASISLKSEFLEMGFAEKDLSLLNSKIRHLEARSRLTGYRLRRIPVILNEMISLRYRYSRKFFKEALIDLVRGRARAFDNGPYITNTEQKSWTS